MKKMLLLFSSVTALSSTQVYSQSDESTDPYTTTYGTVKVEKRSQIEIEDGAPINISFCYEVFSLQLKNAASFRRQKLSDPEIYQKLVEGLTNGMAKQEVFTIIRSRSGEGARSEAVNELIYPTQYDPPNIPSNISMTTAPLAITKVLNPADSKIQTPSLPDIITSFTPTALESRNVGTTIEYDAVTDLKYVSLDIDLEHVALAGEITWGHDSTNISFPEFESQRLRAGITSSIGRPIMLGTLNRPPNSKIDTDAANKVFYAFATVSLANP